ncbi:hypothetical protein PFISCL1PPCAC_7342 [Pristionchus fissidentatus]|uniref:G protein-coupled receptor n=1 Tax=Pristionchus fissidentatus TaxID=1538716 RepID=A0AAV5VBV7_9BILA|nr:hypothetical protein PFISCL1PPCAC_7342 [Pristionchus fissidentatus]
MIFSRSRIPIEYGDFSFRSMRNCLMLSCRVADWDRTVTSDFLTVSLMTWSIFELSLSKELTSSVQIPCIFPLIPDIDDASLFLFSCTRRLASHRNCSVSRLNDCLRSLIVCRSTAFFIRLNGPWSGAHYHVSHCHAVEMRLLLGQKVITRLSLTDEQLLIHHFRDFFRLSSECKNLIGMLRRLFNSLLLNFVKFIPELLLLFLVFVPQLLEIRLILISDSRQSFFLLFDSLVEFRSHGLSFLLGPQFTTSGICIKLLSHHTNLLCHLRFSLFSANSSIFYLSHSLRFVSYSSGFCRIL